MEPTVVAVKEHRTRDGVLEGLCELSDGRQEWRTPSSVEVEVVNDRTGERAHISDVKVSV